MPFLGKMSGHFRGYSGKEEPRSKASYIHGDDYYPSKHEHLLYRNKEKIADYDDYDYRRRDEPADREVSRNGQRRRDVEDDNDVDYLYRRSKEKFASWDIRDLEDKKHRSNGVKSSRRLSPDTEVEEIFTNGDESAARKVNGSAERSGSAGRRRHPREADSLDRQNGESRNEAWSEEDEAAKLRKNNKDYENCGSLKKRNEKNAGLNFRAIVDKFRGRGEDKERKESSPKHRKHESVDADWRYNDAGGHKEKIESNYPGKESKTEKNHRIRDHEQDFNESKSRRRSPEEHERSKRRSYAFEASPEDFDVRIQKYERVRPDDPDLHRRNSFHDRGHRHSDSSQRMSSSRDRNGVEVARKSSMRDKESKRGVEVTKSRAGRVSERHSRPLTPPLDQRVEAMRIREEPRKSFSPSPIEQQVDCREDSPSRDRSSKKSSFSMKEWYESNRQFAAKYLKEHSKIKELATSDAKDEFIFEIEQRDGLTTRREERRAVKSPPVNYVEDRRSRRRVEESAGGRSRRRESLEDEEEEEEDEEAEDEAMVSRRITENYGRSFVMPSRKVWSYRDGV